jgi:hypothetical protein
MVGAECCCDKIDLLSSDNPNWINMDIQAENPQLKLCCDT